jgi:hypothetical protein
MFINRFILLVFVFIVQYASAQQLERQVISSLGSSTSSGALQLDFTVGESFVNAQQTSSLVLTEGYQQVSDEITLSSASVINPLKARLYPNPTNANALLVIHTDKHYHGTLVVYSQQGVLQNEQTVELQPNNRNTLALDLTTYSKGLYFIKLVTKENQLLVSDKLVKY